METSNIYKCDKCDYNTNNKTNFLKHQLTRKHILGKKELRQKMICIACQKEYKSISGLWKHKKKCKETVQPTNRLIPSDNELIKIIYEQQILLQNENKELKSEMIRQNKEYCVQNKKLLNIIPQIGNTTHNKFNINLYLNEHCQNAMNLNDFVNSIKLCIEDMLVAGNQGVICSSKNIIVNNLKALEEMRRPIHCTDVKRNTMYVKDNGIWDKDIENEKLKGAINKISSEHLRNVPLWVAKNPDYMKSSKGKDEYFKIVNKTSMIVSENTREIQSAIKQIGEGIRISNTTNSIF